jgi:ectoine hydroxylase-related dioxygenase (phytanoyl-CoA dioxygenase family)
VWKEPIEQRGFAIIPGVLSPTEVANARGVLSRARLPRGKAGIRHAMKDPAIDTLANQQSLLQIAKEVLGTEAFPFRATLFNKSPDANWLVVWHQDTALPLRERQDVHGWGPWSIKAGVIYAHAPTNALNQVLALRVHLDDSTELNGPLRVLPGTHALGVLTDDEVRQLATKRSSLDCLVSQGGVLAMRPLLIHASSKSQANTTRRVLHIEYAGSTVLDGGLELAVC